MEMKRNHLLPPAHPICFALLKRSVRVLYILLLGLLWSASVKAQSEGFPISVTPCPTVGAGYNTTLYLSTAQEGYEYHWYKGTDYTGTYLASTSVLSGAIGADLWISPYGAGDYVCYVTLYGYPPDPVNFFYGSAVIAIGEYVPPVTPVISTSGGTTISNGIPITLSSSVSDALWYLNGTYIGSGTNIEVSAEGTYKANVSYCEVYTDWSNEIYISVASQTSPPAPILTPTTNNPVRGDINYINVTNADPQYEYHWYKGTDLTGVFLGKSTELRITEGGDYVCYAVNTSTNTVTPTSIYLHEFPTPPILVASKTNICDNEWIDLTVQNYDPVRYRYDWYRGNDFKGETIISDLQTISTNVSGNYICYAIDRVGTWKVSGGNIVSVSESHIPSAPIITAIDTLICSGWNTTLHGTGSGLQWYRDGILLGSSHNDLIVTEPGNYYAYATDPSCGYSARSNVIAIILQTPPTAPIVSADAYTICSGTGTYLRAGSGSNIQWYREDGLFIGNGTAVWATEAGRYRAYDVNNCGLSGGFSPPGDPIEITVINSPSAPIIMSATATLPGCGELYGSILVNAVSADSLTYSLDGSTYQSANIFTSVHPGTYTVLVKAANSCGSSVSSVVVSVIANPLPVKAPIVASGPTAFCQGGSVTLTAPTGFSYLWSNGATSRSIMVSSTGFYFVTIANEAGCEVTSDPVNVTKMLIAINGQRTVCEGEEVLLYASNDFNTYQWFRNGNAIASPSGTGSILNASEAGVYTVEGSVTAGSCISLPFQLSKFSLPQISITSTAIQIDSNSYEHCGPARFSIKVLDPGNSVQPLTTSFRIEYEDGSIRESNDGMITLLNNAEVEIRVVSDLGCSINRRISFFMKDNIPIPAITASGPTSFCQGESVTLTAPDGYTYLWSNGATSQNISITTAGEYKVKVSNADGCFSYSNPVSVMVNPLSSSN